MIKRFRSFLIFALLLAFAATALCSVGCGKKSEPFDPDAVFEKLLTTVKYETELTDVSSSADIMFGELPEGTKVRVYTSDGTSEDALMMFNVEDPNDVYTIRSVVKEYIDSRLYEAERYAPEQVNKLKNAETFINGNTVIYCITDDAETARNTFFDFN